MFHVGSFSLARQLQKEVQSANSSDFTEEQKVIITSACSFCTGVPVTLLKLTSVFFFFLLKKTLAKIATCLEMRSASLQVCIGVCVISSYKKEAVSNVFRDAEVIVII